VESRTGGNDFGQRNGRVWFSLHDDMRAKKSPGR
jgi:hypothetical protein